MQEQYKWGSKFLENLSSDLAKEFPSVKGFSYRNLKNIRQWVTFWDRDEIGKQLVSQLCQVPWGHNIVIIQKSKNIQEAIFYIQKI
jgi:predicted nuclease of restriction endonuclease-like (RecB) superfamily